ncbi:UFD1-domain-containing protein [Rozella allomycis CSF55]|uniref:UFD1-domain-containing protein n=1 Tax=Rozella allomycis (strain CSF55) TaxID=988480 RepID=A0A075B0Q9_ROZAC|nr:Ubiquitin fusion degradation protein UFD1 domain-containing protein [Rozella allomycis CSF55]RKP21376.1 UFD1-domain-containing protein [Rozella allomycis CSF55]|eukprot:EPZ34411.1 Ubiquitin fusion degradation protein UFD1 domain-containing protein [Rozella allomycis CSF55]
MIMLRKGDRPELNHGGKIIMPPSALERLAGLNIAYPMLFQLRNEETRKVTHAGVLEFIAEEGRVYIPQWMMETLFLQEGQLISLENVTLPLGKFIKIQPQSIDFLDIHDPKAVLENSLRNFAALTQGDIISILYNQTVYELLLLEVQPSGSGICIHETDLEVDFAAPLGYVEPDYQKPRGKSIVRLMSITMKFKRKKETDDASGVNTPNLTDEEIRDLLKGDEPLALTIPNNKLFFGFPVTPFAKGKDLPGDNVPEGRVLKKRPE